MARREPAAPHLSRELAARLAGIALACVQREYPNQVAHVMTSDADAGTPRLLHPAFHGCYDWHSSVHTHWCLARLLGAYPGEPWSASAREALGRTLTETSISAELAYLRPPERSAFERPYGLAWLLALDAEVRRSSEPEAPRWAGALRPLATLCAERLLSWIPRLTHPVRTGVHSQTAFAMTLLLDWARASGDQASAGLARAEALRLYGADAGWSPAFEPSGEDFLSPSLAEADLMRRVMGPEEFARWLTGFLPALHEPEAPGALRPVRPLDKADGRLAHLDGLNLSRAWMLRGIADALPRSDPRIPRLRRSADVHLRAGLDGIAPDDYARAHWLGSLAAYALSEASPPATPRAS